MMPATTDVDHVLALLRRGRVEEAVEAYGGDLLPGTNSPALGELAEYVAVAVREALLADPQPDAVVRYSERRRTTPRSSRSAWPPSGPAAPRRTPAQGAPRGRPRLTPPTGPDAPTRQPRLPSVSLVTASARESSMTRISLNVDGASVSDDVEPRMLLVQYLRERLGKTGTVIGCDTSNCGACTVHLNGSSVKSCNVLAVQADGADVTTIEGLATDGQLHPVQEAFRGARAAVRLLHARDDHAERRPAEGEPAPLRGGDPARARGQPVPLHGLPQHREGRAARGLDPDHRRRCPVTATQERPAEAAKEIGRDRRRKEDQRLITGRTCWTDNIQLSGMLHIAMAQPVRARHDHQHRRRGRQGVAERRHRDHRQGRRRRAGALPNARPITPDQVTPNHSPIAVERATFAGEIVAVVVARSAAAARDAAELVDVDYDELPAALDLKEAAAATQRQGPGAPRPRHQQVRVLEVRLGRGRHRRQRRRGDREGPRRWHRDRAGVPPAAPDPGLHEPRSTVVDPTGEQITMWSATQIPHILRFLLAAVTGVSESKIRVVAPDVGGGFGGKLQTTPEEFITFLLAAGWASRSSTPRPAPSP